MISLSAEYKIKCNKLLLIIGVWIITGAVITIYDYLVFQSQLSAGVHPDYSFRNSLLLNTAAALTGGILGGSFLVFYVNEKLRDKPYWITVVLVAISFVLIIGLIAILVSLILAPMRTGKPLADPEMLF
jgi:adenylate cyclase